MHGTHICIEEEGVGIYAQGTSHAGSLICCIEEEEVLMQDPLSDDGTPDPGVWGPGILWIGPFWDPGIP